MSWAKQITPIILQTQSNILFGDGTVTAPSISFSADTNCGIYRIGNDNIGITTNGILRFNVSTTAVTTTLPIVYPVGAAATPSIGFTGDTTTGIYRQGAGTIGFTAAGTQIGEMSAGLIRMNVSGGGFQAQGNTAASACAYGLGNGRATGIYNPAAQQVGISCNSTQVANFTGTGITTTVPILGDIATATAAAPVYSFNTDSDTGMYRKAANSIGFSTLGAEALYITQTGKLVAGVTGLNGFTDPAIAIGTTDSGFYQSTANIGVTVSGTSAGVWGPNGPILPQSGTFSTPSISFVGDTSTGLYRIGAANLGVVIGGTTALDIGSSGVVSGYRVVNVAGSAPTPSVTFTGDLDTGLYSAGANQIGFACNGAAAGSITSTGYTPVSATSSFPIGLDFLSYHQYTVYPNTSTGVDFFTTQPTGTLFVMRLGNFVFIDICGFTGTVAAVTSTMVVSTTQSSGTIALDAEFRPGSSRQCRVYTTLAGVAGSTSSCTVSSAGAITVDHNGSTFTTGLAAELGTSGTVRQSIFYSIF